MGKDLVAGAKSIFCGAGDGGWKVHSSEEAISRLGKWRPGQMIDGHSAGASAKS